MDNKEFKKHVNEILSTSQYKQNGNKRKCEMDEFIKVIELQKSDFSNLYYINYGFIIKDLIAKDPTIHVFARVGSTISTENELIKNTLYLGNSMSDNDRIKEIKYILENHLLNIVNNINTKKDLLGFINSLPTRNGIPLITKKYFGID